MRLNRALLSGLPFAGGQSAPMKAAARVAPAPSGDADLEKKRAPVEQLPHQQRPFRASRLVELIPAFCGLLWFVVAFYPLFYMLISSFRSQAGFYLDNPWLPPSQPTLENYSRVWENGFGLYLLNSLFVLVISVALILLISVPAAYAIARMRNRLTRTIFSLFLLGLAIPLQAVIIPIYALISGMRLYDTLFALILPYVAFGVPLSVLVLVTFIRDIPVELHEAMRLDGASHRQILWRLVIPLSRPALITVTIYESIQVWNGFLFPLVLTQSPEVRVLPLALWSFQGQYAADVPAIMAAVFLSAVPMLLLYIFGRRQLLTGLLAGFSR
ncbi:carbohydrate ABC transporter permease [Thermogemmatispora carboxidivorans]|uniref:carbohydrate ABC transporter permease n=1 Tax=Thermogemmatispora carboxidivorans TaxID=1382306 RepID=UPI00192E6433|nr:carbohydrate ABC transporter permease [Thermogemmatispora carboxidivorans]